MNYSNVFKTVFFIALIIFTASWTALEIKDAFPEEQKKEGFFTCNDKVYTIVNSNLRSKSYLTSTDGLIWTKESSISCPTAKQSSAFEHNVSGAQGWTNITNTATERIDIKEVFQTMGKTFHAVRRNAVGTNTAPNIVIALIEGSGDSRKMNYITPLNFNYQVQNVYLHPQNPRKMVTVAQDGSSRKVIMGILASDGKSFSFQQTMTLTGQAYTKVAFFNNKLYVMGNAKLFSFDMASATDNSKFLTTTGSANINQSTVVVNSNYDVRGKFLVTTGRTPNLFIHHNYQTTGAKKLDRVDMNGNFESDILERATVKSSGTRTSLGGGRNR